MTGMPVTHYKVTRGSASSQGGRWVAHTLVSHSWCVLRTPKWVFIGDDLRKPKLRYLLALRNYNI